LFPSAMMSHFRANVYQLLVTAPALRQ